MNTCVCLYVWACDCMSVFVHMCMHACVCTCIYIYVHLYMYACVYVYMQLGGTVTCLVYSDLLYALISLKGEHLSSLGFQQRGP